jgi:hypothetical protein
MMSKCIDVNGASFVILNMIQQALTLIKSLFIQSDDTRFVMTLSNPMGNASLSFPGKDMLYTDCKKCIVRHPGTEWGMLYIDIITSKKSFTHALSITSHEELSTCIEQLLSLPFRQWHIQMPSKDLHLKFPKPGKNDKNILHHFTKPSKLHWPEQDETSMLLTPENAGKLLHAIGICEDTYHIIPAMRDKYVQINHFIRNFDQYAGEMSQSEMRIIDCGCGQAYVSFALLWYLREIKKVQATLIGIERNPDLIASCKNTAHALSLDAQTQFIESTIHDANIKQDDHKKTCLIALHACDTATDDALALALKLQANIILASPCCHHYVQEQMDINRIPIEESFLLRDGIMKERIGDMLTDSMRRDILISEGFSSDLIEFTSLEHTAKNVMIRAKHIPNMPAKHREDARKRFLEASNRWHVHPKLIELIKK